MRSDELGARLKELRLEQGMTQGALASPYSASFVSTIEAGRRRPSDKAMAHFADKLGVTSEQLFSGVSPSFEPEMLLRLHEGWDSLYQGHYEDSRELFRSAWRDARKIGQPHLSGKALVGIARSYEREGQTEDGLKTFEEALRELEAEPLPARVEAIAGLARCHQMMGRVRLAAHLLEGYLLELEERNLEDPRACMRALSSLVWPYMELGLRDRAAEVAGRALKLAPRVDDPADVAGMYVNVARAHLAEGRPDAALDCLARAEEIYSGLRWDTESARAQMAKAIVNGADENPGAAREELLAAISTFHNVGFSRDEARALNELARVERLLGAQDAAESAARQALQLLSEMDAKPELALAHRELGLAVRERDRQDSESHFRAAIEIYRECGELLHAADTHRLLGDLLASKSAPDGCSEYKAGLLLVSSTLGTTDP